MWDTGLWLGSALKNYYIRRCGMRCSFCWEIIKDVGVVTSGTKCICENCIKWGLELIKDSKKEDKKDK